MCHVNECYLVETGYSYKLNEQKYFNRNIFIPYPLLNGFVQQHNEKGVFCTAYRYNNTQDIDNSFLYGDLYFDFDDENCFENVRKDALYTLAFLEIKFKIKKENVKIFYSGNKGIHIIVPAQILKIEPHLKLNLIFKTIANDLYQNLKYKTLDLKIYDNKRLFRIPNTVHEKSGLYKIPITPDELQNSSEQNIKSLARNKRNITVELPNQTNIIAEQRYLIYIAKYFKENEEIELRSRQRKACKINFIPPCIKALLKNGAEPGTRNYSIAVLASFYKNYGKSLNEAIELINEWNENNINPTGSVELRRTVKSMFSTEKSFGCSTLKQFGLCTGQCKFKKETKK